MRKIPILYLAGLLHFLLSAQLALADIRGDLKQAEELCKALIGVNP